MALEARLRPLAEIDPRTEQAWADLAERAPEKNPFFEPIVAGALARHIGRRVWLLSVERGRELVLCLPLQVQTFRWRGLAFTAWSGWDPLGTPLVDAADAEAAFRAAVGCLAASSGPRLLVLDWVPADRPLTAALHAATAGRRPAWLLAQPHPPRPALLRRDDAGYIGETLHGRHRRKQGNRRRNLEKRLGAPLQLVDEEGRAEAVDRMLSIEVRGWKGRVGSAVMCRADRTAYFREVCRHFAEQGRLQLLSLQAAGTTVAMKCDIRAGDAAFGLRTAYEEDFGEASPGVEIELRAIDTFHASGLRFWDSCTNHLKNPQQWLWPDKRPLCRVVVALGGVLGVLSRIFTSTPQATSPPPGSSASTP